VPFLTYLTLNDIVTLKSRLEVMKVGETATIRKLACGFLFAFHSNYASLLQHFGDKARYWSKIVIFPYPLVPPCIRRPSLCHDIWYEKTRMAWLPNGEKILNKHLFVFTRFTNVMNGHTDTT